MTKRVLTLSRAIDRFIAAQSAAGKSERTLRHYEAILGYMTDLLPRDIDPLAITEDDLLDVFAAWRPLASTTRANRRSVVGTFFAWLARRYDTDDPTTHIERPKKRPKARRRLATPDLYRLLTVAAESNRDLVLVSLLLMTGIRRAELLALRWRDVDTGSRILRVHGKGDKWREVPIPRDLATILADARARGSEHGHAEPQHYVCPRRYEYQAGRRGIRVEKVDPSQPMGLTTPEKALHRLAAKAGIPDADHVSPHDMRRAYADVFLEANPGDIYRLQAILGHADIGTTRKYLAGVEIAAARDAVDRVSFAPSGGANTESTELREVPANAEKERTTGVEPAFPPASDAQPEAVDPASPSPDDAAGSDPRRPR